MGLKQAFDRIRLNDITAFLKHKNINTKYINVIRELNTNNKTGIKTDYGLTKEVPITAGIRQGDV